MSKESTKPSLQCSKELSHSVREGNSCKIQKCILYIDFTNNIFSFPHLDIMTVAGSEVVKAMRKHEKSLSVQLEALRVLLHFMMPGKSSKKIHQIRKQNQITEVQSFLFSDTAFNGTSQNLLVLCKQQRAAVTLQEHTRWTENFEVLKVTDQNYHCWLPFDFISAELVYYF